MSKLFQFEWEKLFSRKWFWVIFLILFGCYVLFLPKPEIEENQMEYETWLEYVDEQTQDLSSNVLYQNENSYSKRNLEKNSQVYSRLWGIKVTHASSEGIRMATDFKWTEIFLAATVVMFICYLFAQEQEEEMYRLLRPTKYGIGKLMIAKQMTLFCGVVVITICFFIGAIIRSLFYSKIGPVGRSLQSVSGYISSPYRISVLQFLTDVLVWKVFAVFTFACVVMLIGIISRQMIPLIGISAGIILCETAAYRKIGEESYFWPIREINLAAIWDTSGVFSDYTNVNIAGWPVNRVWVLLITGISVTVLCEYIGFRIMQEGTFRESSGNFFYLGKTTVPDNIKAKHTKKKADQLIVKNSKKIHIPESFRKRKNTLWNHESYKLLIGSKGIVFLILFIILESALFSFQTVTLTPVERSYRKISEKLVGELSEEKEDYFRNQKKHLLDNAKELEQYQEQYTNGEISQELLIAAQERLTVNDTFLEALAQAEEQYYDLNNLSYEDGDMQIEYVDQCTWNHWFGSEGKIWRIAGVAILIFILSLVSADFFTLEYTTGMDTMQKISKKGFAEVSRCKLVVTVCYALLLMSVMFVIAYIRIRSVGIFGGTRLSVYCITYLSQFPLSIPVWLWWIGYVGIYLVVAIGSCLLISLITRMTKRKMPAIFISLIICGIAIFLVIARMNY